MFTNPSYMHWIQHTFLLPATDICTILTGYFEQIEPIAKNWSERCSDVGNTNTRSLI